MENFDVKIVLGAAFGDEGKGVTVQYLCKKAIDEGKKPLVIRFSGGPQAAHTVNFNGIEHICSTYGSGVLLGVPTLIWDTAYFDPISAKNEYEVLKTKMKEVPPLYIMPKTRIITPYDIVNGRNDEKINWLQEISDVFSGTEIGFILRGGVSVPGMGKVEAGLNLGSAAYDKKKGNELKQGVSISISIGSEDVTFWEESLSYERAIPAESGCILDLFGNEFEASYDENTCTNLSVTLPIPGFSINIDLTEASDLSEKIINAIFK